MEEEGMKSNEKLPPGFRFHPTDEELISYYLINKISDSSFSSRAVADVDLNKSEPWDLPGKAKMGEKEWYFFSLRDRKYPTGVRTNRATITGYWKTTGKDKEIYNNNNNNNSTNELVGMKKTLVFYRGRAPRGEKTNWVMHEYRIHLKSSFRSAKDEWVVCRVFQKCNGGKKYPTSQSSRTSSTPIALNQYNIDHLTNANILQQQMMQQQLDLSRNYINNNNVDQMAELSRVLRANTSSLPPPPPPPPLLMQPQMNYPLGCFTISGLNLNLGGSSNPSQPPLLAPPMLSRPMNQHDVISSSMFNASAAVENGGHGYGGGGGEMNNNGNGQNNVRFMENCMDLDNYWPSF